MKATVRRNQKKIQTKEVLYLRRLRMERSFSIREAARKMGRSSSWLNHLEQGRFDPRDIDLEVACSIYGLTREQLKFKAEQESDETLIDLRDEVIRIVSRIDHDKLKAVYELIKIVG